MPTGRAPSSASSSFSRSCWSGSAEGGRAEHPNPAAMGKPGEVMSMKKLLLGTAAAALLAAFSGGHTPAQAKEYTFALVPKNMNNPFFDQARDGCMKAQAASAGKCKCDYIGPGEHGGGEEQVQVVLDLIAKKVDGIAVSPAN